MVGSTNTRAVGNTTSPAQPQGQLGRSADFKFSSFPHHFGRKLLPHCMTA
jgi:hypothetical protein